MLNQTCAIALVYAFAESRTAVDAEFVKQITRDLNVDMPPPVVADCEITAGVI